MIVLSLVSVLVGIACLAGGFYVWFMAEKISKTEYRKRFDKEEGIPRIRTVKSPIYFGVGCFVLSLLVAFTCMFGYPQYLVWQQSKEGEAALAKAEQDRQIAIQEAKAKEESAKSLAQAEIIRSKGVAEANKIIGDSLQNNEAYIHYLWIEALRESKDQVIYVPTEAGIPITESQRFKTQTKE